jgi:cell division protein FtsX
VSSALLLYAVVQITAAASMLAPVWSTITIFMMVVVSSALFGVGVLYVTCLMPASLADWLEQKA